VLLQFTYIEAAGNGTQSVPNQSSQQSSSSSSSGSSDWSYPAVNKNWGGTCDSSKKQSPIDLPPFTAAQPQYSLSDYLQYRAVVMDGDTKGKFLEWKAAGGQPAVGYLTHNSVKYNLENIAMHTMSEHQVNGKQYDLELQFIHKSDAGDYAAISVLCGALPLSKPDPIFKSLQTATSEGKQVDIEAFFDRLETDKYYTYSGSLTTPPCTEGVTWFVLATVCNVPEAFYTFATNLPGMKDNYRKPQTLNGREINTKAENLDEHWHYPADNDVWGGVCKAGRQQSPIDLPLTVLSGIAKKSQLLNDMQYNRVDWKGADTAHGLKFQSDNDPGFLSMMNKKFNLIQFHMHQKSEHTVAGDQFDLELHFIHKSADGEFAIVAVLCNGENFGTSTFFDGLQNSMKSSVSVDVKGDFLGKLDTTRYFQYPGSLTSPPCTEGVNWVVIASQCSVPKDYLIFLKKYKSMKDNFRGAQPLNDRSVETVELEEAIADEDNDEITQDHIDLAKLPLWGKISFGCGLLLFFGVIIFRCTRKDPMSQALLHDVDEV
jgi:carbonic anhydrase